MSYQIVKHFKKLLILFFGVMLFNCRQKQIDDRTTNLKKFTKEDVARFAISAIMNQPPEIISVEQIEDQFLVSYIRVHDQAKFDYKVKLDGENVIWGNSDGRWRDEIEDERIYFSEKGDSLRIIQTFVGDSSVVNDFVRMK